MAKEQTMAIGVYEIGKAFFWYLLFKSPERSSRGFPPPFGGDKLNVQLYAHM